LIQKISRESFFKRVYDDTEAFMSSIQKNDLYVVKNFFSQNFIDEFFAGLKKFRESTPPSWHPALDGCPDYHRINDEYPKSYVKAKMHSYYFHRWNSLKSIFEPFKELFEVKNFLGGLAKDSFYNSIPSDGVISRILAHQYPKGGGYLNEHADPVNPFSKIQTLIMGTTYGKDYKKGGLFIHEAGREELTMLDSFGEAGDLFVLSPHVPHGVAPVDPNEPLNWESTEGRWMITPMIIRSDYNQDPNTKPKEL
jgi:hypothetical protein